MRDSDKGGKVMMSMIHRRCSNCDREWVFRVHGAVGLVDLPDQRHCRCGNVMCATCGAESVCSICAHPLCQSCYTTGDMGQGHAACYAEDKRLLLAEAEEILTALEALGQ